MELNSDIVVASLIWILVLFIALRLSFLFGKRKAKTRTTYPNPKIEPKIEADLDAVRSAEMQNQLNMIDELLDITSSETLSDQERLTMVHGRLKFFRRNVTFFFDS